MEGKTQFSVATKGGVQEGKAGHTNKKQAQQECDACRSFLWEQKTLKGFERRGQGGGGGGGDNEHSSLEQQVYY